jgi:hypothetical protein
MADAEGTHRRLLAAVEELRERLRGTVAGLAPEGRAALIVYGLRRSTDAGRRGPGWSLYRSFAHHAAFQLVFGVAAGSPDLERAALASADAPADGTVALYEEVVAGVRAVMEALNAELGDDAATRLELAQRVAARAAAPGGDRAARSLHEAVGMIVSGMRDD